VKKVLFLLFSCLLLVAIALPACKAGPAPTGKVIKIGVIGPMQYIQGENHWWGAEMARDEINAAGGVKVGDDTYQIQLIQADSNEINSITDASAAMEKLITVDKAQYVVGGFRTEAVFPMQEVAMDNKTIFLNCGAATLALQTPVLTDYDRYKYYFRVTPFQSGYLVQNVLMEMSMAENIIREQTGIKRPLNCAVVTEGAEWADAITQIMNNLVPMKLGMNLVGTWRPSPTATDVSAEMTAIQAAHADIIGQILSGPTGIPYARAYGELKIPAASVGINVEGQNPGFMEATQNFGNYETTLATFAKDVEITPKTLPFFNAFIAKTGQFPIYTAGTYDAVYLLKDAITNAGTFDSDAVVTALENLDVTTTASQFKFTPVDDPAKDPHDVTYGPGRTTGIAAQWQNGEYVGVWPNPDYVGYVPSDDWKTVSYPGIVKWVPPPQLVDKLKAEAATEPAAPPTPAAPPAGEQPAAPPAAGAVSFAAKTYTNDKYGFSVQYPEKWVERPELMTTDYNVETFGVSGFVPGIAILAFPKDGPETEDWIIQSMGLQAAQDAKVASPIEEETLPGGQKAYTYQAKYLSSTGYQIIAYFMDIDTDDTRLRLDVFTIDEFAPYDEALFSEIAHSITFK
jgi:branched-chain amino acid transport system substrate-binding protein